MHKATTSARILPIVWRAFEYYKPLKKVLSYVSDHPDEALSLTKAASIAAMGRTHFAEYFRQNTGVTFKCWGDFLRVHRAATLLGFSDATIIEVSLDCGFSDATTFTRTFRRIMGMTPMQYRQDHKPQANSSLPDESPKTSE